MVKKLLLSIGLSVISMFSFSQMYTVTGTVKDLKTKEPVIGAAVYELYTTDNGTATDTAGFFSLSFEKTKARIQVAYIGYKDTLLELNLISDTTLIVFIESLTDIEEVEIEDDEITWKPDQDSLTGDIKIIVANLVEENKELLKEEFIHPVVNKDIDPGSLQDIYLRKGKGNNQDLIFIDGSRVYNSSQLFDFMPVIQDNVFQSYDHFVGNYPARYGDYLSSVVDIKIKEGNMKRYSGSIYFDLFNVGLTANGPVIKDKSSLFIATRLSYLDNPYTQLFMTDQTASNEYWANSGFYDLNLKYTHQLTENDKVYLSIFRNSNSLSTGIKEEKEDSIIYSIGRDIKSTSINNLASLNWEHIFSPDFYSNVSLNFSHYNLINKISGDSLGLLNNNYSIINQYNADYRSGNEDISLKLKFDYIPDPDHHIKFGAYFTNHHFRPIKANLTLNDFEHINNIDTSWQVNAVNAQEYILYAEDDYTVNDQFFVKGGLHLSAFNSGTKTFYSIQPRVFAEYMLFKELSIHAAYANYKQYSHFLANNSVGLSADVFIPSNNEVLPQVTNHFVGGATLNLPFDIHIKAEAFYDRMANVIEYKYAHGFFDYPRTVNLTGTLLHERIESGNSNQYGIRVLFNKEINNLKFKIGHTISNSDRQFSNLNFGENFQYSYNKRHNFDFNLNYRINENFNFYVNWVYRSGNYITINKQSYIPYNYSTGEIGIVEPSITSYSWNNEGINNPGNINTFQLPAYHRLDVGANYMLDNHTIGIQIYNLYNRRNADFVDFKTSIISNSSSDNLVKYSIMPFFPTITYTYQFY